MKLLLLRNFFLGIVTLLTIPLQNYLWGQCSIDTVEPISVCQGNTISIAVNPIGQGPYTYSWSPSAGLSCTDCAQPTFNGVTSTNYMVTVTDANNCVSTTQVSVNVNTLPNTDFTFLQTNPCSNSPISFQVINPQVGFTYNWNFGNPSSTQNVASGSIVSHLFNTVGAASSVFTVTLTSISPDGCSATSTQTITVNDRPGASLEDPLSSFRNCDGTNFDLTIYNSTPNPGTQYQIIWGDGTPDFIGSSFPGTVIHQYNTADIFDLYFIVTGANGCVDSMFQYISNITNPAIGAANPGATTGCGPIEMCFPLSSYQNNHPSTIYRVDFGDGSPMQTFPHPPPTVICHDYSTSSCGKPGNAFTFQIQAENACDNSIASITPIRVFTAPQTSFALPSPRGCVNTAIVFQNTSVMGYNSSCNASSVFTWDWGDGTSTTSTTNNNQSHVYTTPGTYTVTLTAVNQCGTSSQSGEICIEAVPIPTFTVDPNPGCIPMLSGITNTSDTNNMCDYTYNWSVYNYSTSCTPSNGAASFQNGSTANSWEPDILFPGAGTYTLRLSMTNSCGTYNSNQTITAQDVPKVTINGASGPICVGASISPTITVNNCYAPIDNYAWDFQNGTPTSANTLNPGAIVYDTPGVHPINVTVSNVCGSTNASVNVTVNAPPTADAGPDRELCVGTTTTIGTPVQAGVTYSWTPTTNLSSATAAMPTVNIPNTGTTPIVRTYTLRARTTANCFTEDQVTISVNPLPTVSFNNPTYCLGSEGQFTPTANMPVTYIWTPATNLSCTDCPDPIVSGTANTTYSVVATNEFGCTRTVSATATVNPLPVVNAGADIELCNQPVTTTLTGTPAGGTWSGDGGVTTNGLFTPQTEGQFTVSYTYTNPTTNCQNSDDRIINVIAPTAVTLVPIDSLCINEGLVALANILQPTIAGGTWSGTGVTGANFNPNAAGVGDHIITYNVGSGSCATSTTAIIRVNPLPVFTVENQTICLNETAQLQLVSANPLEQIIWTPAANLSCNDCIDPIASPTATTTYTVTAQNERGCSASRNATVTVNPLPTVNAGPDVELCNQPIPFALIATPAGGTWSGNGIPTNGIFTPQAEGVYTATYTYTIPTTGCTQSDERILTVVAPTQLTIRPIDSLCIDAGVTNLVNLLQPNVTTGTWQGTGVTGINFNPQIAGVGSHTIAYNYGSGNCAVSTSAVIRVNALPIFTINDATICFNESIPMSIVSANPLQAIEWTPTDNLSCNDCLSPVVNPLVTTTYSVTAQNSSGCAATRTTTVTVNPLPNVDAGEDQTVCDQPIPVALQGVPNTGEWSGSPQVNSQGIFTPNGVENVTLTYTVTNPITGCQNADEMIMNVVAPEMANAGPDQEICTDNATFQIQGVPAGGTWSGLGIDGQGTFSIAQPQTVIFTYTYGAGNCLTTDEMTFTIHPRPVVEAQQDLDKCISAENVILSASPSGGFWSGNGVLNPYGDLSPAIAGEGAHTLVYTYSDPITGCVNTDETIFNVHPLPVVDFAVDSIVCIETDVPFINESTLIESVVWNFGNGSSATTIDGTTVYATAGNYTIQLVVETAFGCRDSIEQTIIAYDPPVAQFSVSPDSLCGPLNASFANTSFGPELSFAWDFGNGLTSNEEHPNPVSYIASLSKDSVYTIELTVSNYCGVSIATDEVKVMPLPIAIFGTDVNTFCSPWTPNFINSSVGMPDAFSWDFGNGTTSNISDSLFQLPVYTADEVPTAYTITMTATNECGTSTAQHTITVTPNDMTAFFNTSTFEGCGEVTVNFTQYTLTATNFSWNFGDGNVSQVYSPTHTYTTPGNYTVTLNTDDGCNFASTSVQITVYDSPLVDFTTTPDSACVWTPYQFVNLSEPLAGYLWDFGDGTTSTLTNPTHAYAQQGQYTVTLTGQSFDGSCVATISKVITVQTRPFAAFTIDPTTGCEPVLVNYTNTSINGQYYQWAFGDGNTSVEQNPTHTFSTSGTYSTRLIVQGANGCIDTASAYVNVSPIPVADFDFSPEVICGPDVNVQFSNLSQGAQGFSWNFGNGTTSTLNNPSILYNEVGTYTVQLTVTNAMGCAHTVSRTLTVHPTPAALFTLPATEICVGTPLLFSHQSLLADSIVWNFGNGQVSYATDPTINYAQPGYYNVTLTVYTDEGCSNSVTATTPIYVRQIPIADFRYERVMTPDAIEARIVYTNLSAFHTQSTWTFGDGNGSMGENPVHDYFEFGEFYTRLVVQDDFGCSDTMAMWVINRSHHHLYVPNAVYPGHAVHDVAHFLPKGIGLKEYLLQIFDDWGNLIWETSELDTYGRPLQGWDATYRGELVQQDAYVWKIHAIFLDDSVWEGERQPNGKFKQSGTITVIR